MLWNERADSTGFIPRYSQKLMWNNACIAFHWVCKDTGDPYRYPFPHPLPILQRSETYLWLFWYCGFNRLPSSETSAHFSKNKMKLTSWFLERCTVIKTFSAMYPIHKIFNDSSYFFLSETWIRNMK